MKHLFSVAAALIAVAVLSSSASARGGGNFVSVFESPKFGTCWIDLHLQKKDKVNPDPMDAQDELSAVQNSGGVWGDFRGIRPDQVAKARYTQCGKKPPGKK